MSINPLLLPINKDAETRRKIVLTNVMKMLEYRKWISSDNLNKNINSVINTTTDEDIYKIKLDVNLNDVEFYNDNGEKNNAFDGKTLMIKLIHQKVTGINKSPTVVEFLTNYKNMHKVIIIDDMPTTKVLQQLSATQYTEAFFETFFLINLMEHICSPKYHVMSASEQTEFLREYQTTKNKLCKIFDSDQAAKYLYLKKGQIVRIERPSEISGMSIGYRVVVHKNNAKATQT